MHRISSRASVLGLKEDLFPLGRRHVHDRVYCLRNVVYGAARHVSKFQTQVENVRFSWKKFKNPQAANPGTPGR